MTESKSKKKRTSKTGSAASQRNVLGAEPVFSRVTLPSGRRPFGAPGEPTREASLPPVGRVGTAEDNRPPSALTPVEETESTAGGPLATLDASLGVGAEGTGAPRRARRPRDPRVSLPGDQTSTSDDGLPHEPARPGPHGDPGLGSPVPSTSSGTGNPEPAAPLAGGDADPILVEYNKRVDAIIDQAGPDIPSFSAPVRTRIFAAALVMIADRLDQLPRTPEGLAEMERMAEVSGVNAAWREFNGMKEKRSARLMLLDCIDMVAPAASAVKEGRDVKAILSLFPGEAPNEYQLPHAMPDLMMGVADFARGLYGMSFPQEAAKVDLEKLVVAINAWNMGGGAPKKGTSSKWAVILDLLAGVGLADADMKPENLAEQWSDYKKEARGKWMPRVLRFE